MESAPVKDPSAAPARTKPILEVADLAVSFANSAGGPRIQAVAGVSMTVHPNQTLAVVGESGCGKSVTAMSTMQLIPRPPGRFDRGSILFEGRDIISLSEREMLSIRGGKIAMIFQEPMTSLNPVYTIGDQIIEAILLHQKVGAEQAWNLAVQAMKDVGIPKAEERMRAYPHQFSGGMRQRVMIAMALAWTIQAQILELLRDLQRTRGMGIMLITHNLGVVAENADVVCVMYAGRVVEYARVFELFDNPLHPYTRGLFNSIPLLKERKHRLTTVEEVVRDPAQFKLPPVAGEKFADSLVPWWPDPPVGVRPEIARNRDEYALVQVAPTRWVGCFNTPWVEEHPSPRPDLDYRRDDL
jgi:ABC-type dipeptide/oligopeptide/nickel transport system ATPase component